MPQGPVLPRGYRYEWLLFTDWCVAAEISALPASPLTVALFLEENPAGSDALRRRVAAINLVHRSSGHPAPGTVTAIRLQLDRARAARVAERRTVVAPIITALPTSGWPIGMFGRRDALVLALHSAGLRPTDIAALDRRDLTADGDGVRVGGGHHLRLVNTLPGVVSIDFVSVWRNWEHVLQVVDRYPSMRVVEGHLRSGDLPDLGAAGSAAGSGPVMVPIDRWGAVPLPPRAMTQAAVSTVLTGLLSGTAPPHRSVPVRRTDAALAAGNGLDPVEGPGVVEYGSGTRLADTHAAGIAARHAAHNALADVAGVFDDVEDRVDALLRRTLDLLDDSVESSEIPRP